MDTFEKIQVGASVGSLYFILNQNQEMPVWRRIVMFIIGFGASSLTTQGLVEYFSLGAGVAGGVGFFVAVIVLPLANTLIDYVKNPSKIVDFIKGVRPNQDQGNGDGKL